jgi:hypothetical protein
MHSEKVNALIKEYNKTSEERKKKLLEDIAALEPDESISDTKQVKWGKNYYGCANELPQDDIRIPRMLKDIEEFGFDETEIWCFKSSLIKFCKPRLSWYLKSGTLDSQAESDVKLILYIFEKYKDSNHPTHPDGEEWLTMEYALYILGSNILGLWV